MTDQPTSSFGRRFFVTVMLAVASMTFSGCYQSTSPSSQTMERAASSRSSAEGRPAGDFALPNQNDKMVRLSNQRGRWVVLYFYPKDDTPGCTCQATEFTKLLNKFNDMQAVVMGVSPDTTGNHRFFADKYDLKITLLSDPDKKVMRQYGAWVDTQIGGQNVGRVIRTTFLIDPQGKIAHHWPEVMPKGHAERVRRVLVKKSKS